MNYQKHYDLLVNRAKNCLLEGYTERHHIIPRCIGGTDEEINLVLLTPEEHYVAHQLLIKIYPDKLKLIHAAKMMTVGKNRNNKLYGWLKRKISEDMKGRPLSEEHKQKISRAKKGHSVTQETKQKISNTLIGKTYEEIYGVEKAEEQKRKRSEAHKGQIPWNKGKKLKSLII